MENKTRQNQIQSNKTLPVKHGQQYIVGSLETSWKHSKSNWTWERRDEETKNSLDQLPKPDGQPGHGIGLSQSEMPRPQHPGSSGRFTLITSKACTGSDTQMVECRLTGGKLMIWNESTTPCISLAPPRENKSTLSQQKTKGAEP